MARREAHFSRDIDLKSSTLELYSYASAKDKHQLFSNSRTSKMVRKTVIQTTFGKHHTLVPGSLLDSICWSSLRCDPRLLASQLGAVLRY